MKKRWMGMLGLILASGIPQAVQADRYDDYRYVLLKGQQHEVCRHMLRVYNRDFSKRPHDFDNLTEVNGITLPGAGKDNLWLFNLKSSFHPTSPEFEAVKWEIKTADFQMSPAKPKDDQKAIIAAHLDIDNDGQDEVVIKGVFNLGEKYGYEELWVYERGEIDISENVIPTKVLFSGTDGKHPPRIIGSGAHIRPFIYKGLVYLHEYDYRRLAWETGEPRALDEPFLPPETVQIWQYLDATPGPAKVSIQQNILCEYRMKVVPQHNQTNRKAR